MNPGRTLHYAHYCAVAAMTSGALFGRGHWAWGVFVLFFCYHFDRRMQDALLGPDDDAAAGEEVE